MIGLRLLLASTLACLTGCASFSHTNTRLAQPWAPSSPPSLPRAAAAPPPTAGVAGGAAAAIPIQRASFAVDGKRGREDVLFFLALSGGGSRAAYLSAATMLKLQTLFDEVDLLQEVDVVSSVSGGSLAGAYYVVTRDETLRLLGGLAPVRSWPQAGSPSPKLQIDAKAGTLRCAGRLDGGELALLRERRDIGPEDARRIVELCEQAALGGRALRVWDERSVKERMSRNYLGRWFLNWFWPHNLLRYWFTAYDRSDIMAQTLEDNLFDTPVLGTPYEFKDANPYRPYIIINATNATGSSEDDGAAQYPFGTVFTFTDSDFGERLNSDITDYSVARAVMGSSAFPFVFPSMTLRDFRPRARCTGDGWEPDCRRYLHLFDGGNSDNLGLKSVKRALFEMQLRGELKNYHKVVVLLVDAFTEPTGARSDAPDARSLVSRLVDTNFVHAVDSLLQANRAKNVGEFHSARLSWRDSDCEPATRSLPIRLCEQLDRHIRGGHLDLESKLVFYHFGFDDVPDPTLRRALNGIPTSFAISDEHVALIDQAVSAVLSPTNRCLQQIRDLVRGGNVSVASARRVCRGVDVVPKAPRK